MKSKLILTLLALLNIATFSGCGCKPIVQTEYVNVPYEVKVPIKCKMEPVNCELGGTNTEVAVKAYECIALQKKTIDSCR